MFVLVAKKVQPTVFTNDKLTELISGEDGLLKEALKRGDLQEMVEVINSVGSILNYDGRQAAQSNLTGTKAEEEQKARDTRVEVCGTYNDRFLLFLHIFAVRVDLLDRKQSYELSSGLCLLICQQANPSLNSI